MPPRMRPTDWRTVVIFSLAALAYAALAARVFCYCFSKAVNHG